MISSLLASGVYGARENGAGSVGRGRVLGKRPLKTLNTLAVPYTLHVDSLPHSPLSLQGYTASSDWQDWKQMRIPRCCAFALTRMVVSPYSSTLYLLFNSAYRTCVCPYAYVCALVHKCVHDVDGIGRHTQNMSV